MSKSYIMIIQVLAPTDKEIAADHSLKKIINRGAYEFTCGSVKGRGAHYGKRYIERWIRKDRKNTKYVLEHRRAALFREHTARQIKGKNCGK